MLNILHTRLKHYVNQEFSNVQAEFRKGKGTKDQIADLCWITEKASKFQKSICLYYVNYAKAFNKLWEALKEMGISDHLTFLLRNLYVGQEAAIWILYGTTNWLRIEKGVQQGCLSSPCLFKLYIEHIMRNAGLEELQTIIKISGQNIANLRYADDTTLMAESKEELKKLLMRMKQQSEKSGLKLNIK